MGSERLTRSKLAMAAIELADREGLPGVSIRRLATELAARPMTLYSYIASKDDLIDLMVDMVVGEVLVDDEVPRDWRSALRGIAGRAHAAFVTHPWILEASGRRGLLGPNALELAEQLLAAVQPLNLKPSDAWAVAGLVNDYTLGHALRVAHAVGAANERYPAIDATEHPHLAAALNGGALERSGATFEAGLEMLLDGIEHRFGSRARPRASGSR